MLHRLLAHYFFVGDDLILNPVINENNYGEHLSLDAAKSFIPRLSAIDEKQGYWANNITALMYNRHAPGVEANGQLPGYDEAALKLQRLGIENMPLNFSQIWQLPITTGGWIKKGLQSPSFILRYLKSIIKAKKYRIAYPLVRSYSDIFVVSAGCIQNFCHYCGVFSATRLFVELAIPTALAFSAEDIATEKNIPLKGRALWTPEDFAILDKYENNLNKLTEHFPEGYLYLHPVKLSKWVFKI